MSERMGSVDKGIDCSGREGRVASVQDQACAERVLAESCYIHRLRCMHPFRRQRCFTKRATDVHGSGGFGWIQVLRYSEWYTEMGCCGEHLVSGESYMMRSTAALHSRRCIGCIGSWALGANGVRASRRACRLIRQAHQGQRPKVHRRSGGLQSAV